MKVEQIIEVIDKLVGGITPIGETNYDNKVKENLNTMIEIVNHYVDEICWIAQMNSYYASIQGCREIARDFVKGLENETDTVKHGGWFLLDECSNAGVYCSACYKKVYKTDYANQKVKSKYCPNCGAIMDLNGE